jgi:phage/plasmid-like protein (TIGR03299 family)
MSRETMQWLNTNTLIGFTDKRGNAWHFRAEEQGAETNHYVGAVPLADVERRLFNWTAVERPLSYTVPAGFDEATAMDEDGTPLRSVTLPAHKAIVRSDTAALLGIFKAGYRSHQFGEWLTGQVSTILDDELSISSAGLLKGGAVAWVEVSVPDTITGPAGVTFRPNLVACTSHDGSLATTYKRTVTATVCDNTLSAALSEDGQQFKVYHSKYSGMKLAAARDALAIVHTMADDFSKEIERLTSWTVTDREFRKVIDVLLPVADDATATARTKIETRRGEIVSLYRNDNRVAPWAGTAFGVLQAFNTWEHHSKRTYKGTDRAERNMLAAIDGTTDKADAAVLAALAGV